MVGKNLQRVATLVLHLIEKVPVYISKLHGHSIHVFVRYWYSASLLRASRSLVSVNVDVTAWLVQVVWLRHRFTSWTPRAGTDYL